ncbi:LOW QUALITY PROTEIN: hypothetical protein YC2023_060074 [Brassica napus]
MPGPVSGTTSQRQCNPACKAKEPFNCDNILTFNRTGFPKNFTFGVSTSAYQIEGAAHRALNSWNYFTHRYPGYFSILPASYLHHFWEWSTSNISISDGREQETCTYNKIPYPRLMLRFPQMNHSQPCMLWQHLPRESKQCRAIITACLFQQLGDKFKRHQLQRQRKTQNPKSLLPRLLTEISIWILALTHHFWTWLHRPNRPSKRLPTPLKSKEVLDILHKINMFQTRLLYLRCTSTPSAIIIKHNLNLREPDIPVSPKTIATRSPIVASLSGPINFSQYAYFSSVAGNS